jgi:hypothetical protein
MGRVSKYSTQNGLPGNTQTGLTGLPLACGRAVSQLRSARQNQLDARTGDGCAKFGLLTLCDFHPEPHGGLRAP